MQSSLKRLGVPGMTGLGLFAFCLAIYLSALLPARAKLAEMQEQANMLRGRLAQSSAARTDVGRPEVQLAAFYQFFPPHAATPDLLEKLYASAKGAGITLDQGEYRLISGKGDKLERYQVTLPVKGSYRQIRAFLDSMLADLPVASLDDISLQRQKVGDTVLESQIKLTIFLESGA